MFTRPVTLSNHYSFFVFGARGTGKSTLINDQFLPQFPAEENLCFDLLNPEIEDLFLRTPSAFKTQILEEKKRRPTLKRIFVDEIQKVPKLLELVHQLIESHSFQFILTGSSARKLKRGGANLLAGRAFVFHLYPFSQVELGTHFDLESALSWGTLPQIFSFDHLKEKKRYLEAYALTYIKEEIQSEQILRKLTPFRKFLPIAAQMNGKILNFSKIAREIGVDPNTVQTYFQILEDTWVGFELPAFHSSVRKSVKKNPKFYLFDPGVKRALEGTLDVTLHRSTSVYGEAFEHWVILECWKRNSITEKGYQFFYLRTKDDLEIDLILKKANGIIAVEIKSSPKIDPIEVRKMDKLATDLKVNKSYYLSMDPLPQTIGGTECLHWETGLELLFK
ncbi:MAG: ATPase [Bdellovibrionaceae bacterium]|nr:ATPase [Pseudobdellovibrionaceae bacterium]